MSVLTQKHVLVIGDENSQIFALEELLGAHGVEISKTSCEDFSPELIKDKKIELILLNHLRQEDSCVDALGLIRDSIENDATPVFVLVNDSSDEIQNVLSLGAADYVTPHEDVKSVMGKIKAVFGQGEVFSDGVAIDITPTEAEVTSTGIRVYVVEDDPLLRNLLSIRMDKSKFPYEFSVDGNDVVPAMHQFKPDVIILDLMLPGRSGFEVLVDVKADDKLKDVPVIVFSNHDGQSDRLKAQELGARGFYVKAMTDLSELIETIESLVK